MCCFFTDAILILLFTKCVLTNSIHKIYYVGEAVHAVSEQGYCCAIRVEIQMTKIVEKH